MKGQINLNDEAGSYIQSLCKRDDVKIIVEIGTWNGEGSTFCVYDSIKGTEKKLISLETSREMYDRAAKLYEDKNEVSIIYGHISDNPTPIDDLDDSFFSDYSKETKMSWYNEDLKNIQETPNVLSMIPKKIDLLILDGGEFSSWDEYLLLKDRSRIIFLDDTRPPTIKNYKAREDLLSSDFRKIITDKPNSRNGFCIFES